MLKDATRPRSVDRTIELALEAMKWVMAEKSIPHKVRYRIAQAHTELHACRSEVVVKQMEREQGLLR